MANSFSASLVTATLGSKAISTLDNNLAPLGVFSSDFSSDVVHSKSTVNVPLVTAGSTGQKDATNFASGNSTVGVAQVALSHYSVSFHITDKEFNEGKRLEKLAEKNLGTLCDMIWTDVSALLTTGNYGAVALNTSGNPANFDRDDLKGLWGEIKGKKKGAVLRDDMFAAILPSDYNSFSMEDGIGIFSEGVHSASDWTGAGSGILGFVAAPSAMAVAAAIPAKPSTVQDAIQSEVFVSDKLGIPVELNIWTDVNTRTTWASYDVAFGVAKADTTALALIS
jgi:hypothetical protein